MMSTTPDFRSTNLLPVSVRGGATWAIRCAAGLLAVITLSASRGQAADAVGPPNIILMLADDMGLGDTSAYQDFTGNRDEEQVSTPNMERLARSGVRFTDAHASSSRCTNTRYGLLTGRYAWRNRMKWWVLFGAQGDPMIERDRPTLATMLRDAGYYTSMVGKWHVGLRFQRADGTPAASFEDADLRQPLFDTPLDHGFDVSHYTSRSHASSGPQPRTPKNRPDQTVGPGHLVGRLAIGATEQGRMLAEAGPQAYVLAELGGRHSDQAIESMTSHLRGEASKQPFFLYYASNSNHTPYTSDTEIGGVAVEGAARSVAGEPMGPRYDFIYENDVALGRLLDYLQQHDDPRRPGTKLVENTIVIFTSDNGAEFAAKTATGPVRSNKGSAYEGGHRVPFLVRWPAGGVGDGDEQTLGQSNSSLIGLHDLFATFAAIVIDAGGLPDVAKGEKGAEDSRSLLAAWRGETLDPHPMFHNDHKEVADGAAAAIRLDNPVVDGQVVSGQWKLFFDASLIRFGIAQPTELFDLATDPMESNNLLKDPALAGLVAMLTETAVRHRTSGGHRLAPLAGDLRVTFDWRSSDHRQQNQEIHRGLAGRAMEQPGDTWGEAVQLPDGDQLRMQVRALASPQSDAPPTLSLNGRGLGIIGGEFEQVESGEAFEISFNRDVIVESLAVVAGKGRCGGWYRVGDDNPLEIYCVDADNDDRDQTGLLSDLGVVRRGEIVRLDSAPLLDVEPAGQWRLGAIHLRTLKETP